MAEQPSIEPDAADPTALVEMRTCQGPCGKQKPITSFHKSHNGEYRCHVCRACEKAKADERKIAARTKQDLEKFIGGLAKDSLNVPSLARLASGVIMELGGVDQFCTLYAQRIQKMIQHGKDKHALDGLNGLVKMVKNVGELNASIANLQDLSDKDLNQKIFGLVMEELRNSGDDLLMELVEARGLRVVGGDEGEAHAAAG